MHEVYTMMAKPARLLIVDDDPMIREMLECILRSEGYELVTAENGLEGLQRAAMDKPDLILLDVSMPPGIDGYEVCRRLKEDEQTAPIPVTFLTFQSDMADRQRGVAVGADDYLSKPIRQDLLIEHVRSHLRVQQEAGAFESAESVIFTLARNVESRDSYTSGHLRRMEHYSSQLAQTIGLSAKDLLIVRYGAILHDVGKIRVREAILNKRGVLTSEEYRLLKQHTVDGAQMISHLRYAPQVAPIILGHHEHWDGSGYPHQLRGHEIPTGARIVAIADAFDAMTTDRPYRRALSRKEALRRLSAGAGGQWDAELVEVFCMLVEQDGLLLSRSVGGPAQLVPTVNPV